MNPQTEREVWSRVRAPGQITAEESVLPERLEALVSAERENAAELRAASGRLRGGERAAFLRMANEDEACASELCTMHYLMTGRRLRIRAEAARLPQDLPEALRRLWQRQREAAEAYEALSRDFSAYAASFQKYARRSQKQMARISAALRGKLG